MAGRGRSDEFKVGGEKKCFPAEPLRVVTSTSGEGSEFYSFLLAIEV